MIFTEEGKTNGKEEVKEQKEDDKQLDLFKVYRTDDLKTINSSISKSREAKKECRTKLKPLLAMEETKKEAALNRLRRLGTKAKPHKP